MIRYKSNVILKTFFVCLYFSLFEIRTQQISEDGLRTTNVLPAETYTFKFNSAGSVDNKGDYSLMLPLMTVPGRGIDLPIQLTYKSGITTDQRATWVGLGWNINPGCITRIVNGVPDNIKGGGYTTAYQKENGAIYDYAEYGDYYKFPDRDQLDFYMVNIPGVVSGLLVPVNADGDSVPDYTFQEYNGFKVQFDIQGNYTTNGVMFYQYGTTFNRIYENGGTTSPTREYRDIGWIRIIDKNGTWYEFGLPLRSEMAWYEIGPYFRPRFVIEYVSSWQLTAINSHDGPIMLDMLGNNIPSLDNGPGTWIRFKYDYPSQGSVNPASSHAQVRNIRPLYFNRDATSGDPLGLLTQTTYLSKIITPTHEAVFETSTRSDISFLGPYNHTDYTKVGTIGDYTASSSNASGTGVAIRPLRLDRIILKQRYPSSYSVFVADFTYADFSQELCRYVPSLSVAGIWQLNNMGKTTLKKVTLGDSASANFYNFKYTDEIDLFNPAYIYDNNQLSTSIGPMQAVARYVNGAHTTDTAFFGNRPYYRTHSGRAGLFYAKKSSLTSYTPSIIMTNGAAAWSLRTIEYPTGAIDTIAYENDYFDAAQDSIKFNNFYQALNLDQNDMDYVTRARNHAWPRLAPDELGIRVKYIASKDPITGLVRKEDYVYSGGYLPGLPSQFIRNSDELVGSGLKRHFYYGNSSEGVEYGTITKTDQDGFKTKLIYSTGQYDDILLNRSKAIATNYEITDYSMTFVDKSFGRGRIVKTENYNPQGQLTSKQSSDLYVNIYPAGYFKRPPGDTLYSVHGDSAGNFPKGYIFKKSVVSANPDSIIHPSGSIVRIYWRWRDNLEAGYTIKSKSNPSYPDSLILPGGISAGLLVSGSDVDIFTAMGSSYSKIVDSMYSVSSSPLRLRADLPKGYVVKDRTNPWDPDSIQVIIKINGVYLRNDIYPLFRNVKLPGLDDPYWWPFTGGKKLYQFAKVRMVSDTTITYETNLNGGRSEIKFITGYGFDDYEQINFQNRWDGDGWLRSFTTFKYDNMGVNRVSNPSQQKTEYRINNKTTIKSLKEVTYYQGRLQRVNAWSDVNNDSLLSDDEMFLKVLVESYDSYGNPLSMRDGAGIKTDMEWSSVYNYARLTKKTVYNAGIPFITRYAYNALHHLYSVTDDHNLTTTYYSDGFGRLVCIKDPAGKIVKEYKYNFKNNTTILNFPGSIQ